MAENWWPVLSNFSRWSSANFGFGSKVSIWLGPPSMVKKMHDLALAFSIGGFDSSADETPSAVRRLLKAMAPMLDPNP